MKPLYNKYLTRQGVKLEPIMDQAIVGGLFVVIPAYCEKETLPFAIQSLIMANRIGIAVNVVVLINCGINDSEKVQHESTELLKWCFEIKNEIDNNDFCLLPIVRLNFSDKEKGAGMARKAGLDQVVAWCHIHQVEDVNIACFDADATIDVNYFQSVSRFFDDKRNNAASIYYEHPIEGVDFPFEVYQSIMLYELHLRYYRQALKWVGFPYAFHTVGSSMAFRASAYTKAGGMTRKQAGEDFYLINKLVYLGGYGEINSTRVMPSPRISHRVIFGTGATINQMISNGETSYETYNIEAFADLKELFFQRGLLWEMNREQFELFVLKLSGRMRSFLLTSDFWNEIEPIIKNCSTLSSFEKRFYEVFNAFKIIKYLNFVHEHFLVKSDVVETTQLFIEVNKLYPLSIIPSLKELLNAYRFLDKGETMKLEVS